MPETLGQNRRTFMRLDERISPREIEIIKFRDDHTALVVKLVTGEALEGVIGWYDDCALGLVQSDRSEITVYLQAVSYYKARA